MSTEKPQLVEIDRTLMGSSRFAIAVSRFNELITEKLTEGAKQALREKGVPENHIEVIRVPGAWELPWVCRQLAQSGQFQALIAIGAVIRGDTAHFEHVATQSIAGIAQVMAETEVPIALGVLTTDNIEQAMHRAGGSAGNKGADAAFAAMEMVTLAQHLIER